MAKKKPRTRNGAFLRPVADSYFSASPNGRFFLAMAFFFGQIWAAFAEAIHGPKLVLMPLDGGFRCFSGAHSPFARLTGLSDSLHMFVGPVSKEFVPEEVCWL